MASETEEIAVQESKPGKKRDNIYLRADTNINAIMGWLKHEADKASNVVELRNEINLLRAMVHDLIGRDDVSKRYTEDGEAVRAGEIEKIEAITKAVQAIGKLTKTRLDVSADNIITVEAFKVWLHSFANAVMRIFPDERDHKAFARALKIAGEPRRGV